MPAPSLHLGASLALDDPRDPCQIAAELAQQRQQSLEAWGIGALALAGFHASTDVRVITPGSMAGEPQQALRRWREVGG